VQAPPVAGSQTPRSTSQTSHSSHFSLEQVPAVQRPHSPQSACVQHSSGQTQSQAAASKTNGVMQSAAQSPLVQQLPVRQQVPAQQVPRPHVPPVVGTQVPVTTSQVWHSPHPGRSTGRPPTQTSPQGSVGATGVPSATGRHSPSSGSQRWQTGHDLATAGWQVPPLQKPVT
jgi:hypothetical protein